MKRSCAIWMLLFYFSTNAQVSIPSYSISVTFQKTTNIIFPYRIEKADIGSSDVIGHKDAILDNVLFLKAGRKGFVPTNLSVYTSDGKFYSFIVQYKEEPDTLNLSFVKYQKEVPATVDSFMDAQMDSDASELLNQSSFLRRKSKAPELKVILNGIYLKDHLLWIRIRIKNHSDIDYRPQYVRFFFKDKKVGKRTAVQENELTTVWRRPISLKGNCQGSYVFGFPEFTMSKQKKLIIQLDEKNGGRTIALGIPAKVLLKARSGL